MSDADESKARQIPAWQQQSLTVPSDATPSAPEAQPQIVHDSTAPASKQETSAETAKPLAKWSISDVRTFLSDPSVKDAPVSDKRSFLETKGVSKEAIDKVLQELQATLEDNDSAFDVNEFKSRHTSGSSPQGVASRDIPPVVTYPEFLVKPQKPPPLVTIGRLVNTAYIAGSLAAVFYGASKYLVEPMITHLTEARHEFATHSEDHVKELNERLEKVVSKVPAPKPLNVGAEAVFSDADSITSDPTELFHRDIGVQTSPSLSRRSSSDSSAADNKAVEKTVVEKHDERLRIMRSHLNEILDSEVSNRDSNGTLETSVSQLREYLNGLVYMPPGNVEYGVWQPEGTQEKDKNDAVSSFRDEIRGVKGMLLNARRFPFGAVPGRVGA